MAGLFLSRDNKMAASEEKFYFQPLKERFNCLEESKEFLEKWYVSSFICKTFSCSNCELISFRYLPL